MLKTNGDITGAVDIYVKYPILEEKKDEPDQIGYLYKIFKKANSKT